MQDGKQLPRREFLKRTASVGAGVAAGLAGARGAAADKTPPAGAKPPLERRNATKGIIYKRLGRTRFMVSALSFGGVQLSPKALPTFDAGVKAGLNFVMAHPGACVSALSTWFKRDKANRGRIFLGLRSAPSQLDRQLKALGTDCVDLLMVFASKPEAVAADKLREQYEATHKAGKARAICLVFHSNVPAVFKAGVEAGWYDVLLPTYNLATRPQLKGLLAAAKKKDIGVLTMKSLRAMPKGVGFVAAGRRFVADGIASVVRTMLTPADLAKHLPLAKASDKTPPAKVAAVGLAGQCTLCGACAGCPEGVAVQDILRTYQYYARDLGWMDEACRQYAAIPMDRLAPVCSDCGRCEAVCPQGLPVRALIREAHTELELAMAQR
jgi:predicted aldo/keto reductase-like oxidoreductase